MNYSDKDYFILHDHMMAIARERDWLQKEVEHLSNEIKRLRNERYEYKEFEKDPN